MSESDTITQSQLATYLKCQRMYRYRYVRNVTVDEEARALDFGRALHNTIEETCDHLRGSGTDSDGAIRSFAEDAFCRQWEIEVSPDSYRTRAHYENDKQLAREAIEHFFDAGPGIDHVRRSAATELRIEFERNGVSYSGYIDNVLRTADGLELVDYKKSGVDPPVSSRKNYIELQDEGEYRPQRVKNAIQAVLYMEGIKQTEYYESGETVSFTYQPLAEATVDRKGRGITFEFDTEPVRVGNQIRENSQTLWRIIETAVDGIRENAFEPIPFEEIEDEQCDRCQYQQMCSAYLTAKEYKL